MKSGTTPGAQNFYSYRLRFRRTITKACYVCIIFLTITLNAGKQPQHSASKQSDVLPNRVLVLYSFGYHLPAQQLITEGFMSETARQNMNLESAYFEYLDITPPWTPEQKKNLSELLLNKYADTRFALIITIFDTAYDFILNEGAEISPGPPVVSFVFNKSRRPKRASRPVRFVEYDYDFTGTLKLAVTLFPETRHVVFLAGTPRSNQLLEEQAKKEFAPFEDKYSFEYTSNMTVEEIHARLRGLPENTICIYTIISSDITGRVFVPKELLKTFSRETNAPFFSVVTPHLGGGIVGGLMYDMKDAGAMLGRTAIDALNGKEPVVEPSKNFIKPMFDWDQIKRWHCDVSRLPPGSVIINRPRTLWGQYREFVLGTAAVILLLSLLVTALALQVRMRVQTERKLRESELHFRTIFDASNEGMVIHELPSGRIIDVNNSICTMFGYTRDEILHLGMDDFSSGIPPYTGTEAVRMIQDAMLVHPQPTVWQLRKKSGDVIWTEGLLTHIRLGGKDRILASIRDITERKKLEEQLLQSQKMESVGRLAGGVAHDFNNMLGVILGFAELSQSDLSDTEALSQYLDQIRAAAEKSRDITRQLLTFSRKEIISPKIVDLNSHIRSSKKNLARLVGEDVHLSFKSAENLWMILIDPTQVDQVLMNLIVNARDAMPDGGDLMLETSNINLPSEYCVIHVEAQPGEYVQLTVSDSGLGMDRETAAHIFEPFYTTKENGKGTGLGLSTVYGIVSQNRGFINVYSEPGKGTTFKIFFPRELTAETDIKELSASIETGREEGTILVVEDDKNVREMTTKMLEKIGYTVRQTESPCDAIKLCSQKDLTFDLLLTDVVMPEMNGKILVEKLCSIVPELRVLYMSGYTEDLVAQRGIVEEGVHFIRKPFSMQTLRDKIKEAMKG